MLAERAEGVVVVVDDRGKLKRVFVRTPYGDDLDLTNMIADKTSELDFSDWPTALNTSLFVSGLIMEPE